MNLDKRDESDIIRSLGLGCMTRTENSEYCDKINLKILQKAASIWINQYPILRSYIRRPFDINKRKEWRIDPKKYFVFMHESKLDNIEFVEQPESACDGIDYKSALESSYEVPFDNLNGPLWRLKCIKQSKQFFFIYTSHHGIGDGKNAFTLFTHYIDILSELLVGANTENVEINIFDSKHSMEELVSIYKAKPEYTSLIETNNYDETLNKLSTKFDHLQTANRTRVEYLKIKKEKLIKLISKMKEMTNGKAKLTSVLNAISAVCLRNLYEKYEMDDLDKPDIVQIKVVVNLRDKLGISNQQQGIYSVIINTVQETNVLRDKASFWQNVQNYSIELHKRIKQNEDMESVAEGEIERFSWIPYEEYDLATHVTSHDFLMSNIGIMSSNKRRDVIECTDYFCVGKYDKLSFAGGYYCTGHTIVTIDQELYWSINFGQKFFPNEFFNEFKELVLDFIDKLIA